MMLFPLEIQKKHTVVIQDDDRLNFVKAKQKYVPHILDTTEETFIDLTVMSL